MFCITNGVAIPLKLKIFILPKYSLFKLIYPFLRFCVNSLPLRPFVLQMVIRIIIIIIIILLFLFDVLITILTVDEVHVLRREALKFQC